MKCHWIAPTGLVIILPLVLLLMTPLRSGAAPATIRLTADRGVPCATGPGGPEVSDKINAAIAGLPEDATLLLECLYRIDKTVRILDKSRIRLTRSPSVARAQAGFIRYTQLPQPDGWSKVNPWYPYVQVKNSSNISLEDFSITGPLRGRDYDSKLEEAHAFDLSGATNLSVSHIDVKGVHGDVIYFGKSDRDKPKNSNITFAWITGNINGRQGVGLVYGEKLLLQHLDLRLTARTALDIEPLHRLGPGAISDLTVEDSAFLDYRNFGFGAHATPTYRVVLRRVQFRGGLGLAKYGGRSREGGTHDGLTLEDVTYDWKSPAPADASQDAITIQDVEHLTIIRAHWSFRGGLQAVLKGTGTVRDSTFSNERGTPAACLGPQMQGSNNVGVGTCAEEGKAPRPQKTRP